MKLSLSILVAMIMQFSLTSFASEPTSTAISSWHLTDLSSLSDLAAFFNGANALLTLRAEKQTESQIKPTVFIYKITVDAKLQLTSKDEWNTFLAKQLVKTKRVPLTEDASKSDRYRLETTASQPEGGTDMRSSYLVLRTAKTEAVLFVYDGIGPSTAHNLPLVHALYEEMTPSTLAQMYSDASLKK